MIADFAEAINGKLYIQGGGWDRIAANQPANLAVAVLLFIAWDETNTQHKITIRLLTEDGDPVEIEGRPVAVEAGVEVGRPPGAVKGQDLTAPLAMRLNGLPLSPGRYRFVVERDLDGEAVPVGRGVTFTVA